LSLWAIVPVKPLRRGKSRLASVLSDEERTTLNHNLFIHTLQVLSEVPEIDHTLVISRDPSALALARDHRARTLQEEGTPELNMALRRATVVAKVYATGGILILPADLPLLNVKDLQKLISLAQDPPSGVIAPDRRMDGTNALLVKPAGLIDYGYGPHSFQKHCERVKAAGARLQICDLYSFSLDLDIPDDLELYRKIESAEIKS
jgi:2-phospho-L-lactate/phosphoenolpyruvate guanylyltransferase